MYTLTKEQKDWLKQFITLMQPGIKKTSAQSWLENVTKVSDEQLASFADFFSDDAEMQRQCQSFIAWIKGGVRPGRPH